MNDIKGNGITRRGLLAATASLPLAGCSRTSSNAGSSAYAGGWVGSHVERGHQVRDFKSGSMPAPASTRRAGVIIVGAGISGLAAARTLMNAGVDDVHVFDLEDEAGGNSRGHVLGGMSCPLGAHYLPVPTKQSGEVIELLESLGLRRTERGVPKYDERYLCHSPQERLFVDGHWFDGLLPPVDALRREDRDATLAQYRAFSTLVEWHRQRGVFSMPTARTTWSPLLNELDTVSFAIWLDTQGIRAPALRWYLDYCCRDDYGAGAGQVSAWAGLHYFASRHGFHAPGDSSAEREAVFTWPEGNAWLSRKMAQPLRDRLHGGSVVLRVSEGRTGATVDVWNAHRQRMDRWTADQVIMAVPLFVAARLLESPPTALTQAAAAMQHAPWLVGNVLLSHPLDQAPGAPPSWDNVRYDPGSSFPSLGYVDAMHQSTRTAPGPTVLTAYWALGGDNPAQLAAQRARLLNEPWEAWAQVVVNELARAHPDLPDKVSRVDLMRYGHGMSIPVQGMRGSPALKALVERQRQIHFAHTDLSSYSVFEEAMYQGKRAALAARV